MSSLTGVSSELALLGGPKSVNFNNTSLFRWPIVTDEDEQAVLHVLRNGKMSGVDITRQFETEYAQWQGVKYALGSCNGTSSLLEAMFGIGIGRGDEMICPSITYWASALQIFTLGATPVFADIHPDTLTINPDDIEHRITPRTKAIMVVHYCGYPCDMDAIVPIARRHNLKLIEDVSHAHGARYKGRLAGTFGDVSAMSMMTAKSFSIGEGGMLCTNDQDIYERAVAFGHYEQHGSLTLPALKALAGLPLGGIKGRMNQMGAAMGRVQLKHYDRRMREIQDAMNRFWDLLEDVPGLRPHRVDPTSGSTMGGWYNPLAHYVPEELDDLPVNKFAEALEAEGVASRGPNKPLHLHPVLNAADVYRDGRPTRIAFADRDLRQGPKSLPISEALAFRCIGIPSFKQDDPDSIARYASAFRKVAESANRISR
ncbi:MAG TPA: DegT/DnrJ/EryC1/StrS family aminotransferase [Tepidisphaeraceae bacterium]|nr:DegT/DnrJ/EryC1/StrS family aminotransferase [Tepidisphaeraceae bacterium]